MLQVAVSQLKTNFSRFIAIALAVIISVLFLSATLIADASLKQMLRSSFGQSYEKADLIISPNFEEQLTANAKTPSLNDADVQAVQKLPGVKDVYPLYYLDEYVKTANDKSLVTQLLPIPPADLNSYIISDGNFPVDDNQVAVTNFIHERYKVSTGDTLVGSSKDAAGRTRTFTVSGIVEGSNNPNLSGRPILFGVEALLKSAAARQPKDIQKIELKLEPGAELGSARLAAERHFADRAVSVNTADLQVQADLKYTANGTEFITSVLTLFAGVALFVSILVISNTFTVLVAGRMRELALLRCIGANRTQIRNSVILESLIIGFTSAAIGVLAAIGLVAAAIAYVRTSPSFSFATLVITPQSIIVGLIAGTLITMVAAFNPAVRATRIAPLAALRPQENTTLASAKGKGMLVTGVILAALGTVLMILAVAFVSGIFVRVALAALGGISAFVGVLMCSRLFVPQAVKLVGSLGMSLGAPGELARVNAVRNPGRTSATATALLVGVTLVTVMLTGAQGARQSTDDFLKSLYPMDTVVSGRTASEHIFTQNLAQKIESSVNKVKAVEVAPVGGKYAANTCVSTMAGFVVQMGADPETAQCYAVAMTQTAARRVLFDDKISYNDDEILMPKNFMGQENINVIGETGSKTLKVVKGSSDNLVPLITPAAAAKIGGIAPKIEDESSLGAGLPSAQMDILNATLPHLWVAYQEDITDQEKAAADEEISRVASVDIGQITGVSVFKRMFGLIIDVILGLVSALLIISVFIALIGMANTLSLSVLERTKENALLRALGLTKRQLQSMLTIESILISLVSCLLGIALGTVFGNFGNKAIFGQMATIVIPWGPILIVIIIAIVAGLLASLLPARRATKRSPVEGLAFE